jgi:hypothetical protein
VVSDDDEFGLGLAEAISMLRDELLEARRAAAGSDIQLPIESMTVVLGVRATRSRDGRAGFRVPLVNLDVGGSVGREQGAEQTVTVVYNQRRQPGERRTHKVINARRS